MYRQTLEGLYEQSYDGHAEERLLCQERDASLAQAQDEQWINEATRMVQCKEQRAVARQVMPSDDLDSSKEDPQQEAAKGNEDRAQHLYFFSSRAASSAP